MHRIGLAQPHGGVEQVVLLHLVDEVPQAVRETVLVGEDPQLFSGGQTVEALVVFDLTDAIAEQLKRGIEGLKVPHFGIHQNAIHVKDDCLDHSSCPPWQSIKIHWGNRYRAATYRMCRRVPARSSPKTLVIRPTTGGDRVGAVRAKQHKRPVPIRGAGELCRWNTKCG